MLVILGVAALTLQGQLWFSGEQNAQLRERNQALDAEVVNLKQSSEAAEERARTDLGMIGPEETFYQVVPVASATN
jgi:cell division protein FtsB